MCEATRSETWTPSTDPWEKLQRRNPPIMVPYAIIGYVLGIHKGDLLFSSSQGSGSVLLLVSFD